LSFYANVIDVSQRPHKVDSFAGIAKNLACETIICPPNSLIHATTERKCNVFKCTASEIKSKILGIFKDLGVAYRHSEINRNCFKLSRKYLGVGLADINERYFNRPSSLFHQGSNVRCFHLYYPNDDLWTKLQHECFSHQFSLFLNRGLDFRRGLRTSISGARKIFKMPSMSSQENYLQETDYNKPAVNIISQNVNQASFWAASSS